MTKKIANTIHPPSGESPPSSEKESLDQYGDPFSECGAVNQNYFAMKYSMEHGILYEPGVDDFYVYDTESGLWRKQTVAWLKLVLSRYIKQHGDKAEIADIGHKLSNGVVGGVITWLRGHAEKVDPFNGKHRAIHLRNGMLDLNAAPPVLKQFSQYHYSRNQSPIVYDPAATCPRFLNDLLRQVLKDADIELLQRWAGMALMGSNLAQRILIQTGPGGSGKSTFASVIEKIIGTENVAMLRTTHLGGRFELAGYYNKSLLSGKDVSGDFLDDRGAHVLKALVGGDQLDAEKKGGSSFPLRGNFNVIISTNTRLKVRLEGDHSAWRRRLLIVEYGERPAGVKTLPGFDDTLVREEGAGIVNWMVEGLVRLLREIKADGCVKLSTVQADRIENLLAESESVSVFARKCIIRSESDDVTVDEIVSHYNQYCITRGWLPLPVRRVEGELRDVMNREHQAAKRNDIKRAGKHHRGFAHLRIQLKAA